ncbi:hypothetical protein Ancab_038700 [Ancistrocladus abbreviatus]
MYASTQDKGHGPGRAGDSIWCKRLHAKAVSVLCFVSSSPLRLPLWIRCRNRHMISELFQENSYQVQIFSTMNWHIRSDILAGSSSDPSMCRCCRELYNKRNMEAPSGGLSRYTFISVRVCQIILVVFIVIAQCCW